METLTGRLDRSFWLAHLFIPLAVAALVLFAFESSGMDLWLADRWYALEGFEWTWRKSWLAYDVIHQHGKQALVAAWLAGLATVVLSYRVDSLVRWRRPLAYLLTAMALLPAVIAGAKHFSQVPCPWDLSRYGGELPYRHNLGYPMGGSEIGHCFPAGHASGGFALLAVYFAAYPFVRRPALFLLPGLLVGALFALGQQARGAHFISHDLWTLSWCWFGALGLFFLFRPRHWLAQPVSGPSSED